MLFLKKNKLLTNTLRTLVSISKKFMQFVKNLEFSHIQILDLIVIVLIYLFFSLKSEKLYNILVDHVIYISFY